LSKPIELPLPPSEVEGEIRRIAQNESHKVFTLDHTKMRILERGITIRQIMRVLAVGELVQAPKWDAQMERGWRCVFAGITAGVKVTVVAKLVNRNGHICLVVTTY
jgi:hypothetical protein